MGSSYKFEQACDPRLTNQNPPPDIPPAVFGLKNSLSAGVAKLAGPKPCPAGLERRELLREMERKRPEK